MRNIIIPATTLYLSVALLSAAFLITVAAGLMVADMRKNCICPVVMPAIEVERRNTPERLGVE
jgi:hypothetical protein